VQHPACAGMSVVCVWLHSSSACVDSVMTNLIHSFMTMQLDVFIENAYMKSCLSMNYFNAFVFFCGGFQTFANAFV